MAQVETTKQAPDVLHLKVNSKNLQKKYKPKSNKRIFPEGREPNIPNESAEARQMRRMKSRMKIIERHPTLRRMPTLSEDELGIWLKSRDNNVIDAVAHIFQNLVFRRDHNLDTILCDYTPPSGLVEGYPGGLCGEDKDGSPISYELLGRLNLYELMASFSTIDLIKFKLWQFELIKADIKRKSEVKGSKIKDFLLIVDLQGLHLLNFWSQGLDFIGKIFQILQVHYLEMVKEIVIINPTGVYTDLYQALRPAMSLKLRNKITVLGSNYLQHLLVRADKHELPACLGGYRCDYNGDQRCQFVIKWPSQVPALKELPAMSTLENLRVLGGCEKVLEYHVAVPHSKFVCHVGSMSQHFRLAIYREFICDPASKLLDINMTRKKKIYCFGSARYLVVIDNRNNYGTPLDLEINLGMEVPTTIVDKLNVDRPIGDLVDFTGIMSHTEKEIIKDIKLQYPGWTGQQPINKQ